MADMNQNFALQTGIGDLKYAVATEACADRNAIAMALQQVLNASNANTQRLLDTMCQDKIDAKNETIAMLRQQLQMAELAASQNAQTSTILNACGCNSCGCGRSLININCHFRGALRSPILNLFILTKGLIIYGSGIWLYYRSDAAA